MKKSISKVIMLTFAVVLALSCIGTSSVLAADTAVFMLDSGNINITQTTAGNPNILTLMQNGIVKSNNIPATDTIVIAQQNPLIPTTNNIALGMGVSANIKFNSNINIALLNGSPAISVADSSALSLSTATAFTQVSLTGGSMSPAVTGFNSTVTINSGNFVLNHGIQVALTVNGGTATLTQNTDGISASSAVNLNSGTLNLNNGNIVKPVVISGGTFNLNDGSISSAVTIGGGTFNLNSGTVTGALTLNGGALNVSQSAAFPQNLTVNGGTYKKGNTPLYKTTVTIAAQSPYNGNVTYTCSNPVISTTANAVNGIFTAYLPAGAQTITTELGGILYTATNVPIVAGAPNIATLTSFGTIRPIPPITRKYTGTRFENLGLPSTVYVQLDGSKNELKSFPVVWRNVMYTSSTTASQTIYGDVFAGNVTLKNAPPVVVVTLRRSGNSGGGGGGNYYSDQDSEYSFWQSVLSDVENANSGETVYVYASTNNNMPSTILEKLRGKNVTLEINRSNGSNIIIYGKNVKQIEKGRVTYPMSMLSEIYHNGGAASSKPQQSVPTTAPSTNTAPPAIHQPPTNNNYKPPVVSQSVSESSSGESSSNSESAASIEEDYSSQDEITTSEEEVTPVINPEDIKPKPKPKSQLSPLSIAILVTVIAAILSGIVACIIIQRKSKHDQF